MATTKVQLTLDIEYDIHPSKYNKLEIQKILAFMCHEIQRDNLYSWADVEVTNTTIEKSTIIKIKIKKIKEQNNE
jgi:hypothetical protein